nr:PREDICTED: uncharacterized protein LOC109038203 [Bemisia tabaci]
MTNYGSTNAAPNPAASTISIATTTTASAISIASTTTPLSGGEKPSFRRHMTTCVTKRHGDLVLLICYIITGLLDSFATAVWGSFVSMQTGNTVYVGLGIVDPGASTRWIKSASSIASFCVGSFWFSRLHRVFTPTKRWVLVFSFTVQLSMIVAAALIVLLAPPVKPGELRWQVLVPLSLVAFQSSGQAVASRALEYSGLTSVVLTSSYCDLFSDRNLFAGLGSNVERNRRTAAPILLLTGVVIGGFWSRTPFGIAGALWTAAALKFGIVVAWFFWRTDSRSHG